MQSTRYRDLADLAIFAHTISVAAEALRRAITSEGERRRLELPQAMPATAGSSAARQVRAPGQPAHSSLRVTSRVPGSESAGDEPRTAGRVR